ncbi:hypothetical protein ACIQ9Q_30980 [Streptomyces sp. NPDC094438]
MRWVIRVARVQAAAIDQAKAGSSWRQLEREILRRAAAYFAREVK